MQISASLLGRWAQSGGPSRIYACFYGIPQGTILLASALAGENELLRSSLLLFQFIEGLKLFFLQMGSDFLRRCKAGVFQFVVVKFLLAVLTLLLRIIGCYEEGNYSSNSSYLWITLLCCCSQSWALYSLFMFYHCSHRELITMRPFMKFFCLKMVIFFCWWQALGIGLLVKLGHINGAGGHSVQEVADLIQDLLISMEMLVAAVTFFISFPIAEFATVRQLNWPHMLLNPSSSSSSAASDLSGTTSNAVSSESQSVMKAAFVPPMGGLLASSVACIANRLIGNSHLALLNSSDSQANSGDNSSNLPQQTIVMAQQIYMSIPDLSADLTPASPPSDFGNSHSVPARKIFLPYAAPPVTSDRNVMKDRKDKNAQRLNDRRDWGVEGGLRSDPQLGAEKKSGFNLSAPLSILGGMGFLTLRSLIPSSSYSASTSGSNKKTERYAASPSTVDIDPSEEAATECDSDPEVASLIRRGSFDSSEHCTRGSSPDGSTTGDGAYSAGRSNSKGFVSIAAAHQNETAGSFLAVSDSRGGGGGMNTGPNQDLFPSPVARRRAVVSHLTAANVNAKVANSHFDDYLEEDENVEEIKALIYPKKLSPSFFVRSSLSPFSHDKDHSPFNGDKNLSIGEGGGDSPFMPLNAARGSLDNRRKVFVPRDDSIEAITADTSSASFYPPRSSFSAAPDSIQTTASETSEGADTPPSSSGSSNLNELHYFPGGYTNSSSSMMHNSSQAYNSPQRDLFRESARDSHSSQREERHLSREKDHFIGNSCGTAGRYCYSMCRVVSTKCHLDQPDYRSPVVCMHHIRL
jgi:hypothetical protein